MCLISVVSVSATILFTSSCGEQTYTVSQEYFENWADAKDYYDWLDSYLCDTEDAGSDTEDPELND